MYIPQGKLISYRQHAEYKVCMRANTEETRRAEFLRTSMIHRCDDLILDQAMRALDYRTSESSEGM
jgi:hypothetical protein